METLLNFWEDGKEMSDLVRYPFTFSVFHGIKFFGRGVRKNSHGKIRNDGDYLTKSLVSFSNFLSNGVWPSFPMFWFQKIKEREKWITNLKQETSCIGLLISFVFIDWKQRYSMGFWTFAIFSQQRWAVGFLAFLSVISTFVLNLLIFWDFRGKFGWPELQDLELRFGKLVINAQVIALSLCVCAWEREHVNTFLCCVRVSSTVL